VRLSKLYGKNIYDKNDGKTMGEVRDVLIDLEKGEVQYLMTKEASKVFLSNKSIAKKEMKSNLVPYEKVDALGDIVLVGESE
jgi:sporulation protein YlmC with PRC-barrel domain